MQIRKLHDKFILNFLAKDEKNAADIMEAGNGYIVPGIASTQFDNIDTAIKTVQSLKRVVDIVSIGLGDGGNAHHWKKTLAIAAGSDAGHVNQPFEKSVYAQGYLGKAGSSQMVNAMVKPTGEVGKIKLPLSNTIYDVDVFMGIASSLGIESIKFMPLRGVEHLDELIHITKKAHQYRMKGVEPAGGINVDNIGQIIRGVINIDIPFFMPHIFGYAIDPVTGLTEPQKVQKIYKKVEG